MLLRCWLSLLLARVFAVFLFPLRLIHFLSLFPSCANRTNNSLFAVRINQNNNNNNNTNSNTNKMKLIFFKYIDILWVNINKWCKREMEEWEQRQMRRATSCCSSVDKIYVHPTYEAGMKCFLVLFESLTT